MAQKSASTIRGPTVMSYRNLETENTVPVGSLLCAERSVVVVGAATGTGQAVAAAFAAAGVRRLAFVDSDDTSATQDLALKAAAANKLTPPDLLTLHLQRENSVSLEEKVEEVRRKWGHVDIIINHADHMCLSVAYTALKKQAVTDQQAKCFECGSNNAYDIIHAFIPLLLAGPEKTLINILPPSSPVLKLGAGAEMIAEMANGQMADCLMVDHGHEGLLAYSIHLSGSSEKGRSYPANQDHLNQSKLDGNSIVYLTAKRREWLAGRHVSSSQDVRELVALKDAVVRDDLLRYRSSLTFELPPQEVSLPWKRTRGRVPRSSY